MSKTTTFEAWVADVNGGLSLDKFYEKREYVLDDYDEDPLVEPVRVRVTVEVVEEVCEGGRDGE